MNSSAYPEWAMFAFGALVGLITTFASRMSSKLLRGRSIKEVVDSANAIIEMYEKHVGALELKVNSLEKEIASLKEKLDQTLQHNVVLQNLLMASPAITLQPKAANE